MRVPRRMNGAPSRAMLRKSRQKSEKGVREESMPREEFAELRPRGSDAQTQKCGRWPVTHKIGAEKKNSKFTCYATKIESIFKTAWECHKYNTDEIKAIIASGGNDADIADAIGMMIQFMNPSIVRIHSSGDFFHPD